MKILKKTQLLVVLLTASSLAFGAAEEPNSQKGELQFIISDEPVEWDASWERPMQITKRSHVAVFQLDNLRYENSPYIDRIARVQGKLKRLELVTFPKADVETQPYQFLLTHRGNRPDEFWLYAASEQEARKMAELFIRYAKSLADVRVRRAEAKLEYYRKKITDIENEIPKLEEKKKPVEAELAKIKEKTYYLNKDDAQRSILEWNNLLNMVEVDIIGIQAKIDMINKLEKKYHTEERPFGGLIESLRKMRMAEEIELAGASARKNAAQWYRNKALKFLDLAEKLDSFLAQLSVKQDNLSDYQKSIANLEGRLPQERANVRPVEVVGNEVKIHPLK